MVSLGINRFKQALARRDRQVGLWSSLCSTIALDVVTDSGFDWILIDTEHAPNDLANVLALLQVMERGQSSAIVRPAANDPVTIKRLLDVGAQTLLLPFVQGVDAAQAAVAATRYPPAGIRGVTSTGRASRYGRVTQYLSSASREICVLVQVETAEALRWLDAIAQVDGVDGIFIGPSDLAASMGHLGAPSHAEVQQAIRDALSRLVALDVPGGILARDAPDATRYFEWGATFVAVGSDLTLLAAGADRIAGYFRRPNGEAPLP